MKEWQIKIKEEQQKLQEEMEDYNDIVLVDVVDHYRNIPSKLLKYLSRLRSLNIIIMIWSEILSLLRYLKRHS